MAYPVRRRVASSSVAGCNPQDNNPQESQYSSITLTPRLDGNQFSRLDLKVASLSATRGNAELQLPVLGRADSEATLVDSSPSTLRGVPWSLSRCQSLSSVDNPRAFERQGLQWTTFKWCLVWSTISVFVYGTTTMICALLTWFRSKTPNVSCPSRD